MNRIDSSEINTKYGKYKIIQDENIRLNYNNKQHRFIIKRLLQETIKNELFKTDNFWVEGIGQIIEKSTMYETDKFRLHKSYKLSLNVSVDGYYYLSIFPKSKYRSQYYLSEIDDINNVIRENGKSLLLNMNYNSRSQVRPCKVLKNKSVHDSLMDKDNRSLVEYHKTENYNKNKINETKYNMVKNSDNPPIKGYTSFSDELLTFPQELLAIQPNMKNIRIMDKKFLNNCKSYQLTKPDEYYKDSKRFIEEYNCFELENQTLEFEKQFVNNSDNKFDLKYTFKQDDKIMKFSDGKSSDVSDIDEYGCYKSPNNIKMGYIVPEHNEDKYSKFRNEFLSKLDSLKCNVSIEEVINYDIRDSTDDAVDKIIENVSRNKDIDCLLVIIPKQSNSFCNINKDIFYDDLKKFLSNNGFSTQFVNGKRVIKKHKGYNSIINNLCISFIAKSGGIPYTVEHMMPDDTDIFMGIDIGKDYNSEKGKSKISRVGVGVAVFNDGTIISSNSGSPQMGEKISSKKFKQIVREIINAYRNEVGKKPEKISIHRDGFLNEDIDNIKKYLKDHNIEYNIIEIKKTPSKRILKKEDEISDPTQGIICLDERSDTSSVITYGHPSSENSSGTPRPIKVSIVEGDDNIEKISKEVYLLSESHYGSYNTIRTPITTEYADRICSRVSDEHLINSDNSFKNGLNFL